MLKLSWHDLTREQKLQALRDGIAAGLSASQMALQFLDCTRNTIIGVAHRAKIDMSRKAGAHRAPREVKAKPAPLPGHVRRARALPKPAPAPKPAVVEEQEDGTFQAPDLKGIKTEVEAPGPFSIHFMKADDTTCRFPLWANNMLSTDRVPFEQLMVCGEQPQENSHYCSRHHRRAHYQAVK